MVRQHYIDTETPMSRHNMTFLATDAFLFAAEERNVKREVWVDVYDCRIDEEKESLTQVMMV